MPAGGRVSSTRLEQGAVSDDSIMSIHAQLRREKPEPEEGFPPFPIAIVFVVCALALFAGIYLSRFSGDFDPLAFNPAPRGAAVEPGPAVNDPVVIGRRLYSQNCKVCHQETGVGIPNTYPPLAGSDWVAGGEERLIRILLAGLSGPVEVNGMKFNNAMPAFGPTSSYRFNEQKIAAVLTYVRGNADWGNNAPPVTPEKVKEVMDAMGVRPAPWTAGELEPFK
jgi:mono/diheme cytochrome c family protein